MNGSMSEEDESSVDEGDRSAVASMFRMHQ